MISGDWQDKLTPGINGETISLQLMDWASRKSWAFQLKRKSEIQDTVINLLNIIKTQLGHPVKTLFLDQGTNFTSRAISDYCKQEGIYLTFLPVDTKELMGRIERLHRTHLDDVRCMLAQSGLPLDWWPYAMDHSNYTRNYCPVAGLDKVPNHAWSGHAPEVSHLRAFGQVCWPKIPSKDIANKFQPLATSAIFVGCDEQSRTYRCLDSITNGLILAPYVKFH